MNVERFAASPIGSLVPVTILDGEQTYDHYAFVPSPLPDEVILKQRTWEAVTDATAAITRLDGTAFQLPNPYLLVRPSLTKEAVSTSALEGTYAAIEDVLQAEFLSSADLSEQTAEVRNYVLAAELGLELIKTLPICLRLVTDIHGVLMGGGRGDYAEAGRFRTRQNWIGSRRGTPITEALFVPPPAGNVLLQGLGDWEAWVNRDNGIPTLAKAAMAHYQFEALHPFVDGNGRVGRLVATLTFMTTGTLRVPLLNISPFFEEHRDEYVDHLRGVSESGDFEPWIAYFSEAVRVQSERALAKAVRLIETQNDLVSDLHNAKIRGAAVRIASDLIGSPVVTATAAASKYNLSYQGALNAIEKLVEAGVLRELTGRPYARLFASPAIINIISE